MKASYKNIFAVISTVLFSGLALTSNAQVLPSVVLDQNPTSLAMGMSGIALEAGAYALQNNVAAISFSDNTFEAQVGAGMWQPNYADSKIIGGGATYRLGKLGFGLDFRTLRMPEYSGVSDSGSDIRDSEFAPSETNFSVGASYAFLDCISAGVTLRYAGSNLALDASAKVFSADMAVYFKKNGVSAGLSLNNIGTKVKYSEESYPQPMTAKVGAGYNLESGNSNIVFAAEADIIFSGGIMAGAGCEYSFKDMVFARAGYHYGNSVNAVPSYASAGLGVKFFGAQLNFAYLFGSEILANSMIISIGYSF